MNEYSLEIYLEAPKHIMDLNRKVYSGPAKLKSDLDQVALNKFDEVCSALRLFKKGQVGYNYLWASIPCWGPDALKQVSFTPRGGRFSGPSNPTYVLSNEETTAFLAFLQAYQEVKQSKRNRIDVAIHRFNLGYERYKPEDRLIDYIIAFEALLLGDQQELRYKLALRVSSLLGKHPAERRKIFDEIAESYKQRNNIVHGGSPKNLVNIGGEQIGLDQLVDLTEEHLRSAIKEFLVLCRNKPEEQIIKALDEKIVSGQL